MAGNDCSVSDDFDSVLIMHIFIDISTLCCALSSPVTNLTHQQSVIFPLHLPSQRRPPCCSSSNGPVSFSVFFLLISAVGVLPRVPHTPLCVGDVATDPRATWNGQLWRHKNGWLNHSYTENALHLLRCRKQTTKFFVWQKGCDYTNDVAHNQFVDSGAY